MIIKYFPDTDTLYVTFTEREIVETVDFNDDTLLDLDREGNVVALTLEHARANVDLTDISFQQIAMVETVL
ncbi:MAG TPA: DUF2283 domain-containing protein, partial [Promineifilum sp.]|nr:DUF2283 domain-containing protein [Promineifilum sp.]